MLAYTFIISYSICRHSCRHKKVLYFQWFYRFYFVLATNWQQFNVFSLFFVTYQALKPLILLIFATTMFVLFATSTCLRNMNIISIYHIYNIIDIWAFAWTSNFNIYNIYFIYCIMFFYILWTNRGHCPHLLTCFFI